MFFLEKKTLNPYLCLQPSDPWKFPKIELGEGGTSKIHSNRQHSFRLLGSECNTKGGLN